MMLILSARFANSDFEAEFGKMPPSFLPLLNKRLYEHQIKLLKPLARRGEKIFLTLPKGFKIPKFDELNLRKLGVKILRLRENLSLGESLLNALNSTLLLDEPLHILYGDTLFASLKCCQNALGLSRAINAYSWESVAKGGVSSYALKDKVANIDSLVLNGYFCIQKPKILMQSLVRCEYDFLRALKIYAKALPFTPLVLDKWYDCGTLANFIISKKSFTSQRAFNTLKIKEHFVEKSSQMNNKIAAEKAWFDALPKSLCLHAPRILHAKNAYKSEYLYLNTLSDIFVFGTLPLFKWKEIFKNIKEFLIKLHGFKSEIKTNFNYTQKSLERIANVDFTALCGGGGNSCKFA